MDKSFAWMAQVGLEKATKLYPDLSVDPIEPLNKGGIREAIDFFQQSKKNLIIGIGFPCQEAITKSAAKNTNQKFVLIDGIAEGENILSITFREEEGAFLAGYLAASLSKSGRIGFIGGMPSESVLRFGKGYMKGAYFYSPKAELLTGFVSKDIDGFSSPQKAKALADKFFKNGVDIIFAAAGGSGLGVIEAARENEKLAIGVDADQDYLSPGNVLTSVMKRIDRAILAVIEQEEKGTFKGGILSLGLKEEGISLTPFKYTKHLISNELSSKLEEIKEKIINGTIKIEELLPEELPTPVPSIIEDRGDSKSEDEQ